MDKKLLIIEDEETLCASLKRVLTKEGYNTDTVSTTESALELLNEKMYDLIITDIILPGMNGIELLRRVKEKNTEQLVVVMTAYASLETAVEALRAGAYDYIVKPVMHEEIKQIVRNAIRQKMLQKENLLLRCQLERQYDLETISIYRSPVMQKIIGDIKKIADDPVSVLLLGETGTEKEFIARLISMSGMSHKPFVSLRCNSADINSFRKSIDDADGGIVFLDDLLCLDPELQASLIDILETGDVRIISAANQYTEKALLEGAISSPLYQKIKGHTIQLPPLRERKEDIEPLALYSIQKYSEEFCKQITSLDSASLELLKSYSWPGNARELQNIIERAVLLCAGDTIKSEHLPRLS